MSSLSSSSSYVDIPLDDSTDEDTSYYGSPTSRSYPVDDSPILNMEMSGRSSPFLHHVGYTTSASGLWHKRFMFPDGNVTLMVEGISYKVHRYFFERDSLWFRQRFENAGVASALNDYDSWLELAHGEGYFNLRDGSRTIIDPRIIILQGIKAKEFDTFLSVLYPRDFARRDVYTVEGWTAVLKLATRWSFASIQDLAIQELDLIVDPVGRLVLARAYEIYGWDEEALGDLCARTESLSVEEMREMSIEDIAYVVGKREKRAGEGFRTSTFVSLGRRGTESAIIMKDTLTLKNLVAALDQANGLEAPPEVKSVGREDPILKRKQD
ncbi:hypothetical protein OF83DRAFT_372675 [Amylostereum chailletii]|nr:hypothetical protein OF83DRAFT_372675 [Amylostereum chailletii]